jgi:hypothetical protein
MFVINFVNIMIHNGNKHFSYSMLFLQPRNNASIIAEKSSNYIITRETQTRREISWDKAIWGRTNRATDQQEL